MAPNLVQPIGMAIVLVLLALVCQLVTVSAVDNDFGVVVRSYNPNATRKDKRKCKQYNDQVNAQIQLAFDNYFLHRRMTEENHQEPSRELSTLNCSQFCSNVAFGWCFYASAGICNDHRRGLRGNSPEDNSSLEEKAAVPLPAHRSLETTDRKLFLSQNAACSHIILVSQMNMFMFAINLQDEYCKTFFLEPFTYDCLFAGRDF